MSARAFSRVSATWAKVTMRHFERSASCRPSPRASSWIAQLLACPSSASSDVPPIDSMPIPCLPEATAPTGEREQATAISMAGCV